MSEADLTKIAEGTAEIYKKAWSDDSFRAKLVQDPKSAIKELGIPIPDDLNIEVLDQTDGSKVYFPITPKPDLDNMELTDEQLEQVAGGEVFGSMWSSAANNFISSWYKKGGEKSKESDPW